MNDPPFIQIRNITKTFGDVVANNQIELDIQRGELHALVGENGAGKTTLMRVLMGVYEPDEGEIYVDGSLVDFSSPRDAIKKGMMMVAQHSSLVGIFNAIENLLITERFSRRVVPSFVEAEHVLQRWEKELGYSLDLDCDIDFLPYAERQKIEVVRALCCDLKLLILDEPTSMLPPQYAETLYGHLRRLLEEGIGVFYTTHKLSEALDYSDTLTVLRQGTVIFTKPTKELTREELIRGMVGEEIELEVERPTVEIADRILSIQNLSSKDDKGATRLKNFQLEIFGGEIVGVAGTPKSGKLELVETMLGLRKGTNGTIMINEMEIRKLNTKSIIKSGVGYVPEGANLVALVRDFTVAENSVLTEYDDRTYAARNLIAVPPVREHAAKCVEELNVITESIDAPASCLSGGNAQKLVLAREFLRRNLKLLVLVNPTAGLDIRTTRSVWQRILALKKKGIGILILSEELNELKQLSDRIVVLFDGSSVGAFPSAEISIDDMGAMMLTGSRGTGE
ncbi:MAG: ABC transporter ATP-binding protein [Candidatus Thorarchaeota archaeon]